MNTSNYMGVATSVLHTWVVLSVFPFTSSFAQVDVPLPTYEIRSVNDSINVDGLLTEPAWQQTPVIDAFSYPWFKAGQKERTEVRMLWDPATCTSSLNRTMRLSHPDPARRPRFQRRLRPSLYSTRYIAHRNYFNFEFNAITILDRSPLNGSQQPMERRWH